MVVVVVSRQLIGCIVKLSLIIVPVPSAVEFGVGGGSRSLAAPAAPVNLTTQQPFYFNGVLSVNVSWVLTEGIFQL